MLGVLGGMGPMATVDFMAKVIRATPASRDQEHISMEVCSATEIPDRTAAILGLGPDPLPAMCAALRRLEHAGASVIAMPCSTAHHWHDRLQSKSEARILHIVEAVADRLAEEGAERGRLGILATTGTVMAGIYRKRLERRGIDCLSPPAADQAEVMRAIGLVKGGDVAAARGILDRQARALIAAGCDRVVMACTEIPLALTGDASVQAERLIDPTDALALAAVRACTCAGARMPIAA